jgi:hypothetical protein
MSTQTADDPENQHHHYRCTHDHSGRQQRAASQGLVPDEENVANTRENQYRGDMREEREGG